MTVVSNASPLIALERIQQIELLQRLFGYIVIPPAVRVEVFGTQSPPDWIVERKPTIPFRPSRDLGKGETEAIALTLELHADWLLMDDLDGRKEARRVGVSVMGTIGILVRAKCEGIISTVSPFLNAPQDMGFYFSDELRATALQLAGEML